MGEVYIFSYKLRFSFYLLGRRDVLLFSFYMLGRRDDFFLLKQNKFLCIKVSVPLRHIVPLRHFLQSLRSTSLNQLALIVVVSLLDAMAT